MRSELGKRKGPKDASGSWTPAIRGGSAFVVKRPPMTEFARVIEGDVPVTGSLAAGFRIDVDYSVVHEIMVCAEAAFDPGVVVGGLIAVVGENKHEGGEDMFGGDGPEATRWDFLIDWSIVWITDIGVDHKGSNGIGVLSPPEKLLTNLL